MSALINDLLDYAKATTDQSSFEPVSLDEVCHETSSLLGSIIKEKKAVIKASPLPVIHGQKTAMSILFRNILGNALKYQAELNQPTIEISSTTHADHHVIQFKDNGIGIAQENLEKIFKRFSRLHSNEVFSGTGMGLATCKKIVESHSGKLSVTSTPGKGTTFYITLPCSELTS